MADTKVNTTKAKGSAAAAGGHDHALSKRLPVTVITGFLGSGKTTLLSYILNNKTHGYKIAVINNEFASALDIGTKHELAASATDRAAVAADIYETGSGCLCCSGGRNDLVRILHELTAHTDKFNYVLLETTGMADPSFASVFQLDPHIRSHFYLDGFVTLVDAKHAVEMIDKPPTMAVGPDGKPLPTVAGAAGPTRDEIKKAGGVVPAGADQIVNETVTQLVIADRVIINKTDLVADTPGALDALEKRIAQLNPLATTIRAEYARIGDLGQILSIKAFDMEKVLTTKDSGFLDFRPYRRHDPTIQPLCFIVPPVASAPVPGAGNVQLEKDGNGKGKAKAQGIPLDLAKFEAWARAYTSANRQKVLRLKAVLNVEGKEEKYMAQGVKDLISVEPRQAWESDEPRVSRLVLIGKDLDEKEVVTTFNAAMRNPALPDTDPLQPKLRVYGGQAGEGDFAVRVLTLLLIAFVIIYNYFL